MAGRCWPNDVGIGFICDNMPIMKLSIDLYGVKPLAGLAVHDSVGGPRQCGLSGDPAW